MKVKINEKDLNKRIKVIETQMRTQFDKYDQYENLDQMLESKLNL